ncbi:beta-propeller fold lactonase family protein [Paucilactobacillus hokkaidonensis]|uniref:beta-propeller fold lactonase family protein n=1 Tax=Paucilactobacillus hokkaidonensis TaxID=1193095 RepID=UPI0006D1BE57|nr:beta-propeller fold lactonase family protein [Paucilactobacillus hokkaidonensis]
MEKFFLGTYTKRLSKGIYSFDFDVNTGEPSRLKLVGTAGNPTYLAMGNNNLIYCIDNSSQYSLNNGGIKVFDVSQNPAKIVYHLHDAPISGAYISFDKNTRRLFTANYHANQLSMYRVNQSSCTLLDRIDDIGEVGPEKEQKDGPHPHFINLTPEGRVVVCDLGLDKIFIYDISNKNRLELKTTFTLPAGFGPRHIRFDLKRKVSYVVGELSSNVATLKYDEKKWNIWSNSNHTYHTCLVE